MTVSRRVKYCVAFPLGGTASLLRLDALALFLPSSLLETDVLEHLDIISLLIYGKSFNKVAGVLFTQAK